MTTVKAVKPAPEPSADLLLSYIEAGCAKAKTNIEASLGVLISAGQPASKLAHVIVMLRQASDQWNEVGKVIDAALDKLKTELVPAAFEAEGITNFSLDTGYRVTVSTRFVASIKKGHKEDAYEWLRDNALGDLITETVNAQTLAAAGKAMLEDGKELPEEHFNSAFLPNTSITKTAK